MRSILFNGKFLSAPPTGVHRVAEEIIRAADRRLFEGGRFRATLLCPKDANRLLPLRRIPHRKIGRLTWQAWEQADLPRLAGPGLLVNLCNLGPVLRRDAVTMIHDAQVAETPASYTPAFRAYYRAIQPIIARRHRAVLTVSEYARRSIIRHGVAHDAIVIPNGADHVHRFEADRTAAASFGLSDAPFVLALASQQAHKNIGALIRAFRSPQAAGATLALFGDARAEGLFADLPPNVRLLGRITDEALFGLMRGALAFACPSRTEGFGLPPAEAMALGCPVVAAPCGALPEVCGDAALYADPGDPSAWADAVAALAATPHLRREMSEKGLNRAATMTWDAAAGRLLDFLEELESEAPCAA